MDKKEIEKLNIELVSAYHNALLLEETKRKYSRTTTSFRGRNLMEELYKNGDMTAKEVSNFLKISKPSATSLIDKLESLSYITRKQSTIDERSYDITLTRKGRLVTTYQMNHRDRVLSDVLSGFDDKEKEILLKGFNKLNEVLSNCGNVLEEEYLSKEKARKERSKKNGK